MYFIAKEAHDIIISDENGESDYKRYAYTRNDILRFYAQAFPA